MPVESLFEKKHIGKDKTNLNDNSADMRQKRVHHSKLEAELFLKHFCEQEQETDTELDRIYSSVLRAVRAARSKPWPDA